MVDKICKEDRQLLRQSVKWQFTQIPFLLLFYSDSSYSTFALHILVIPPLCFVLLMESSYFIVLTELLVGLTVCMFRKTLKHAHQEGGRQGERESILGY
jgi:hypothetical protein